MPNYRRKFSKIYDQHIDKIYRFIFLKVDSEETAQDLTAQVFTKGWKKYKTGTDIKNINAYLFQIARNEIAGHYREESKINTVSTDAVAVVDDSVGPEETRQRQSDIQGIKQCLSQLKEDYQNVLIWRYTDGYSDEEIAEMLGKSKGAVRVMVHRALKELRGKMQN